MSELLESVKSGAAFLGVCFLIFAALVILAILAQRLICKDMPNRHGARYVAYVAMFSAIAGVLMLFDIPLFFAPSFYKIDLSEIPVLICTFYLGPVAGVITEFLKNLLKILMKGTTTAFVGDFANFVIGCSMVLPASIIYHCRHSRKNALIGLITGTLVMTVFGSLFNAVYLLPKFSELYGMPLESIVAMGTAVNGHITSVETLVLYAVVPFNLLKGLIVTAAVFFLYKRLSPLLSRGQYRKTK